MSYVQTTNLPPSADQPTAGPAMIEVRGLGVAFQTRDNPHPILAGVDLTVRPTEFLSIVGSSGTGKTTLLRCIAGLQRPTTGQITVDGVPVTGPPSNLALIFQDYGRSLFPWLRVLSNVTLPLRANRELSATQRREVAMSALDAVGLADAAQQYPWQLSGGMQQRTAIARALAFQPEVLLMDEPFASVDAQTRSDLEDLVLGIRQRYPLTLVMVTHDVDESVYMADRVAVLGGHPAHVTTLLPVDLPTPRDQLTTKSLPEFIALRAEVLKSVRTREEV
ncbi:ABC transporter ATP-binding protein [Kutzneria sp. NPDC052558]|uniref:ABC transporter ATP-binding protein n=1 Tax=Kutzneria sp. NPDC052558 TaxID=3364121 RepID=UPI0037CAFA92